MGPRRHAEQAGASRIFLSLELHRSHDQIPLQFRFPCNLRLRPSAEGGAEDVD